MAIITEIELKITFPWVTCWVIHVDDYTGEKLDIIVEQINP